MEYDEFMSSLLRIREAEIFAEAQAKKYIEDAVLIMNPKYKDIIAESGVNAFVLWSLYCPEERCFMVTDEDIKREIKRNTGMMARVQMEKEVKADD